MSYYLNFHCNYFRNTLEVIRDNSRFGYQEVNDLAQRAFVQVDNPHDSQWTKDDVEMRYDQISRPHWHRAARANKYQSIKVLGKIFDMLTEVGGQDFNCNDTESQINVHIQRVIEKAEKRNANRVQEIREDMGNRLKAFNMTMSAVYNAYKNEEVQTCLKRKAISDLFQKHRSEIVKKYEDEDSISLIDVMAILYEETFYRSLEKMVRFKGTPYVFAWEVGQDRLTRIIGDGNSEEGCALTVVRGKDCTFFGK
jgi:hypothetical protein